MHELQHPLGVYATVAADQARVDNVTSHVAVANLACASSFATTATTTAMHEIKSSYSSNDGALEHSGGGGECCSWAQEYRFVFFAPLFPFS
jgi:hypothetical protein